MLQKIYQVDSFTAVPFKGNPAGVCIMGEAAPDDWMQDIAAEMNLSETAFVFPEDGGYNLRWFTPRAEVDLCGHATLATAHILWEAAIMDRTVRARFHTKSGVLTAAWVDGWIKLDFPSEPPFKAEPPPGMLEALGVAAKYVGKNASRFLVEVESEGLVRGLEPDFKSLVGSGAGRVIVTSQSEDSRYDFVSRFFAPGIGIDEDPVTGSAHCCLGPYWMEQLGKNEFTAFQASERGGELRVSVVEDRVHLFGQAVTVFEAKLR